MKRMITGCMLLLLSCLQICAQRDNARSESMAPLSRVESEKMMTAVVDQWKKDKQVILRKDYEGMAIHHDTLELKLWKQLYGHAPVGDRSMYISMHGGGGVPSEVNNQQWNNQKYLYRPAEGLYVAPRAPVDAWNMWCQPGMDELLSKLIQAAVVFDGVNPDKVYLMGYSAGGDGVWRMAPRMADTWAAASMMAGHPGDVRLINLRNTPYMIWCGALDAAYDRNKLDRERGLQMDSLQKADPEGYIHETHIVEGKPHWMDRVDTLAVSWMAQYQRNPYPKKIVWGQEEVLHQHFYWLTAPQEELARYKTVRLEVKDNRIDISECGYTHLTLWLNDELVNLDKKVGVYYQGRKLFKGKLKRTRANIQQSMRERDDNRYVFPARVEVKM